LSKAWRRLDSPARLINLEELVKSGAQFACYNAATHESELGSATFYG